jgi:hypothetical protein
LGERTNRGRAEPTFAGLDGVAISESPLALRSLNATLTLKNGGVADLDTELTAGDAVGEQFEIVRLLGRGGMGEVYEARDLDLGRRVAIKIIRRRDGVGDTGEVELFRRDATATARLQHPNIVTLYGVGIASGNADQSLPYMVLELLRGQPLDERLREGALSEYDAVTTARQVLVALEHAHAAGVIHRDLKAANVFVQDDGLVKVLDFGIALMNETEEAAAGPDHDIGTAPTAAGTPAYMAPEQWTGAAQDARTDVWAVGIVLYEMLTGERPFATAHDVLESGIPLVTDIDTSLSAELDTILAGALAKNPAERYADASAMLADLDTLLSYAEVVDGNPYRYLDAFDESTAPLFFGREREANRLLHMVAAAPLVAVVGGSGAGKSSLVHAGLVPRLRREQAWTVVTTRPGASPLRSLTQALWNAGIQGVPADVTVVVPRARPGIVGKWLRDHATATDTSILVVVDNLEELFVQSRDRVEQAAFGAALLAAADDPVDRVRIVLLIREDFLSRLGQHPGLHGRVEANLLLLPPPTSAAMLVALREPARIRGVAFEADLAEAMVDELAGETEALPLLQFAAARLWDARDPSTGLLTRELLDAAGGVSGLLSNHADDVLDALRDHGDVQTARDLLCRLVTHQGTRCRVDVELLRDETTQPERLDEVLGHLADHRLVTVRQERGVSWAELAHESLVAHWPRLRRWLTEDQTLRLARSGLGFQDRSTERGFRAWHDQSAVPFVRVGLFAAAVSWGGALLAIFALAPPQASAAAAAVAMGMLPVLALTFGTTVSAKGRAFMVPSLMLTNAVSGLMALFLSFGLLEQPMTALATGTIAIYLGFFTYRLRLRAALASIAPGAIGVVAAFAWAFEAGGTTASQLIVAAAVTSIAFGTGALATYVLERVSRDDYRREQVIEHLSGARVHGSEA